MIIQERKIIPYQREAIPVELDRLDDPNFEPIQSNCERAIQLAILAVFGVKTSLRAREGYLELGKFIADYKPQHKYEFLAKAQPGYILYTEPRKRTYPDNPIEREQMLHPVMPAGTSQDHVAQTLAAAFSLRLDGYLRDVQLVFHATHKVKDGVGNAICFWTFGQLQEDYELKRLRDPKP